MSACSIDREPHGSLSSNKITENPDESVDAMVRGVYAQLKSWSDPMHRCGEYAGDNIMIRGASTDAFFEFITFNRTGTAATKLSLKPPTRLNFIKIRRTIMSRLK